MGDGCLNNEHFEELGGILKGKLEEHFKNQELRHGEDWPIVSQLDIYFKTVSSSYSLYTLSPMFGVTKGFPIWLLHHLFYNVSRIIPSTAKQNLAIVPNYICKIDFICTLCNIPLRWAK